MDLRLGIQNLVEEILPFDSKESEHKEFTLLWLKTAQEIFRIVKPATPDTHLVVYFAVLDLANEKILLVNHKIANLWLPPGGHVDPGEHPKAAVRREAKEELGIEANFLSDTPYFSTVTKTVGSLATVHTDVTLWYLLKGEFECPLEYDDREFYEIKWFAFEDIPYARTDPHMDRFIKKLRIAKK